jgi:hypothetical protein
MPERSSCSYSRRLLYSHLNLRPLGLLSHAPFCHQYSLVAPLFYISLFLYTVVSAFLGLLPFQRKKRVESLSFSNGFMNVSLERHGSRLPLFRISVVLFSPSRHVLACNMQPNTTSSQANRSNYPSLSCNKMYISIKVSLNIQRNNILEAVKRRVLAFNSAGLPGDLWI